MKKTLYFLYILITFFLLVTHFNLDAQQLSNKQQRILSKRGSDSAWVHQRFLINDLYFLGNQRVKQNKFYETLMQSDETVLNLLRRSLTNDLVSGLIDLGSIVGSLILYRIMSRSDKSFFVSPEIASFLFLVITEIPSQLVSAKARRLFREGVSLFNTNVKNGSKATSTKTLHFGLQNFGVGLALRF